jgi:AhpD family alkylhydroperoxidase
VSCRYTHQIDLEDDMQPRIESPAMTVAGAMPALQRLGAAVRKTGLPETTLALVELRASQINGCAVCADMHSRELKAAGEPDKRIFTLAAWRETPYFSDAERAALALTEAVTRIADRPDPVSDDVWDEAARHYDEPQLSALVLAIAGINAWNRINAATRQITGDWVAEFIAQPAAQAA